MQTTFSVKVSELPDVMKVLSALFQTDRVLEITVNAVSASKIKKEEINKEYWAKIKKRIDNIDKGHNLVNFTWQEFEKFSNELAAKYKP